MQGLSEKRQALRIESLGVYCGIDNLETDKSYDLGCRGRLSEERHACLPALGIALELVEVVEGLRLQLLTRPRVRPDFGGILDLKMITGKRMLNSVATCSSVRRVESDRGAWRVGGVGASSASPRTYL